MKSFDRLPAALRRALNYSSLEMSSYSVLAEFRRHGLAPTLRLIDERIGGEWVRIRIEEYGGI